MNNDLNIMLNYCKNPSTINIRTIPIYILEWIYPLSKEHIQTNKIYNIANKNIVDFVDNIQPITLIPSQFDKNDRTTMFNNMIEDTKHKYDLFIFNDNEEDYLNKSIKGAGNAVIRPYKNKNPPHSWGIPTGSRGIGYNRLDEHTKQVIDESINDIKKLLKRFYYKRIIYSAEPNEFTINAVVIKYITDSIKKLVIEPLSYKKKYNRFSQIEDDMSIILQILINENLDIRKHTKDFLINYLVKLLESGSLNDTEKEIILMVWNENIAIANISEELQEGIINKYIN